MILSSAEIDAFGLARVNQRLGDPVILVAAAELAFQNIAPVHTLRRQIRIEQKRAVTHLGLEVGAGLERAVEPALADEAPGQTVSKTISMRMALS